MAVIYKMNREQLTKEISSKIKTLRSEYNLTQEAMAQILGISKKTLVQIEKGRILAAWPVVVSIASLFKDSTVLQTAMGGEPLDIIRLLAFEKSYKPLDKTLGGHVWWKTLIVRDDFRLQQNLISQHYRIIDSLNYRWFSTFEEKEAKEALNTLVEKLQNETANI